MIFQISRKLSVARDLPQTYRQTVPQTRPCNSKASTTKSVHRPSFRLLTPVLSDAVSLYLLDFNEIWHKYSSCEWALLKRF